MTIKTSLKNQSSPSISESAVDEKLTDSLISSWQLLLDDKAELLKNRIFVDAIRMDDMQTAYLQAHVVSSRSVERKTWDSMWINKYRPIRKFYFNQLRRLKKLIRVIKCQ